MTSDRPPQANHVASARPAEPGKSSQAELLAFLGRELSRQGAYRRIQTHAGSIFLAGDKAWKLKRAVRYPYLDFSTPERRRAALEAEFRLNRRTAPDLYLGVHPIIRTPTEFRIGGDGEPIDWVLEMRRFPDDALLDTIACKHRLDMQMLTRLTDRIHRFHESVPPVLRARAAADFQRVIEGNGESLRRLNGVVGHERIGKLIKAQQDLRHRHSALLNARGRHGRVRHTHGDLHLANIALIDGEAVPFDCLEFDDELATTDVLYDLAFLLMDLWHRGLRCEANLVFNRYIDVSADEDGARLLALFMSVRATIRAHVLAAAAEQADESEKLAEAREFLTLAETLLRCSPIALVAIGGLSGSGKSAIARAIGGRLGTPPGARIIRSDVLRKRRAGVPPEQRLPESCYSGRANRTVYKMLADCAVRHLAEGTFVIADAVFSNADDRAPVERAAASAKVPFIGCWLNASEANRLARVGGRSADASDADASVVKLQSAHETSTPRHWMPISADGALPVVADATLASVEQAIGRRPNVRGAAMRAGQR